MTPRHKRLAVVLAVATSVALAFPIYEWFEEEKVEPEFPTPLGRHIEKLKEATPGNQGVGEEGPWSSAETEFVKRAYPADSISVEQAAGARNAFAATMGGRSQEARGARARG